MIGLARIALIAAASAAAGCSAGEETAEEQQVRRPMVVVDENDMMREEKPPHGAIGDSTAYHISDAAPGRMMEFRKRTLHVGAAVGEHPIGFDEVYYVLSGEGDVISDGETARVTAGMAAYLYRGSVVGIRQVGEEPLTIIIAYPRSEPAPG